MLIILPRSWIRKIRPQVYLLLMNGSHGLMPHSSIVIKHLKDQREAGSNIGIAFLFFGTSLGSGQRYPYLMASLVQQLMDATSHTRIGSNRPKIIRKESSDMNELTRLLRECINQSSHTYIIVDALDECSNDGNTRTLLIEALREISPQTHILVTSRPTIQSARTFPSPLQLVQLEVRPEDAPLTLEEFVEGQLKPLKLSPSNKEKLIKTVLERSNEE